MLFSKANAALTRLKEIEEKYKIKRIEQKWNRKEDADSSISSVSMNPSEDLSAQSKESPRNVSKPKLDIKMPDTRYEERVESTKFLSQNKKPDRTSPKIHEAVDLNVAMLLEDKSPRSMGKQESLVSDITTIQENSSIESVLDYSMTVSKSLSHSKTSRQSSTTNNKSSRREERIKAGTKSEKGKQSDKSSEFSRKKSSDSSLITKRSKLREKSNKIFEPRSDLRSRKHSGEEEEVSKISREASLHRNSKISNHSGSSRNDSVIGESISTLKDGSEIISELSLIDESVAGKTENGSINAWNSSEYLITENASANISKNPKYSIAENGYANDTFEDISSSTVRSKSGSQNEEMIDEKREIVNLTTSSTKTIEIVSQEEHRFYQGDAESHRNGQIELFTPKTMRNASDCKEVGLDKETSKHVKNLERIDANPDNANTCLLKSPKSVSSHSKKQRRPYKRRTEPFEEKVPSGDNTTNLTKNVSGSSTTSVSAEESSIDDVTKTDERTSWRESSAEIRMIPVTVGRQESGQEERGKASDETKERTLMDAARSPVTDDGERIEPAKLSSSKEKNEDILEKSPDRQISQDVKDVTSVLRRLHKDMLDAVARRRESSKTIGKASENSSESETEPEPEAWDSRVATRTRKMIARKGGESDPSSEKDRMSNHNSRERNVKRHKRRAKITNLKSSEARNRTRNRKEDKALRHDRKQIHGLQKRTVELRLRREREDLQKYLHELKDLKLGLGSGSTRSYFSPLEFPKIAEFTQSDVTDLETKPDQRAVLQERVSAIRRWLKDQYILYRDYCTMAQAINAHYVPTTLDDAKKEIEERAFCDCFL